MHRAYSLELNIWIRNRTNNNKLTHLTWMVRFFCISNAWDEWVTFVWVKLFSLIIWLAYLTQYQAFILLHCGNSQIIRYVSLDSVNVDSRWRSLIFASRSHFAHECIWLLFYSYYYMWIIIIFAIFNRRLQQWLWKHWLRKPVRWIRKQWRLR